MDSVGCSGAYVSLRVLDAEAFAVGTNYENAAVSGIE